MACPDGHDLHLCFGQHVPFLYVADHLRCLCDGALSDAEREIRELVPERAGLCLAHVPRPDDGIHQSLAVLSGNPRLVQALLFLQPDRAAPVFRKLLCTVLLQDAFHASVFKCEPGNHGLRRVPELLWISAAFLLHAFWNPFSPVSFPDSFDEDFTEEQGHPLCGGGCICGRSSVHGTRNPDERRHRSFLKVHVPLYALFPAGVRIYAAPDRDGEENESGSSCGFSTSDLCILPDGDFRRLFEF